MSRIEHLPRIRVLPPRLSGRLFSLWDVDQLIIGDLALSKTPSLEAFCFYGLVLRIERVDFWGAAARLYADRATELLAAAQVELSINAFVRFEQIDIIEDGCEIAQAAVSGGAVALLDAGDPLEARLIDSLRAEARTEEIT